MIQDLERRRIRHLVIARSSADICELLGRYTIGFRCRGGFNRGIFGAVVSLVRRDYDLLKLGRTFRGGIVLGTGASAVRRALLLGARSLLIADESRRLGRFPECLSMNVASAVLAAGMPVTGRTPMRFMSCPTCAALTYLHPNRFVPDSDIAGKLHLDRGDPYGIIRYSSDGYTGVTEELAYRTIMLLKDFRMFIVGDSLPPVLRRFRFPLTPDRLHHALAGARFFLGPRGPMAREAVLLGTPAFCVGNRRGDGTFLAEMGERYGLARLFTQDDTAHIPASIERAVGMDGGASFASAHTALLAEMIDPFPLFMRVIDRMLDGVPVNAIREDAAYHDWVMSVNRDMKPQPVSPRRTAITGKPKRLDAEPSPSRFA